MCTRQRVMGFQVGQDTAGFAFGGSPWGVRSEEARGSSGAAWGRPGAMLGKRTVGAH